MKCPRCQTSSEVLRTDVVAHGKRRTRRCLNTKCEARFYTTEAIVEPGAKVPAEFTEEMISKLRDGRGYDREALAAALRTDARRAQIERARRAQPDEDVDEYAPSKLTFHELKRMLGK